MRSLVTRLRITGTAMMVCIAPMALVAAASPAAAAVVGNDYPANLQTAAPSWNNSVNDGRGFFVRNCTSFVAWRMAKVNGVNFFNAMTGPNGKAGKWGDAQNWDENAWFIGYPVDNNPVVGSIAQKDGGFGHVAWVAAVHGDGNITIEQYNANFDSSYSTARVPAANYRYIHVQDLGGQFPQSSVQMFIRGDNAIFAKNSIGYGGWVQEADPGNASAIAVGGNTQMFIRGDGAVFAKNSIGNGGWVQETSPGNARAIAVSSTGVQMFIRGDNAIFAKNSIGYGGWVQEADPGNASAIAVGGNTQMFIRGDGAVFAKNSIGNGGWVQETSPGNARAIAVSSTGVQMFIRGDNAIFAKNSIGYGGWVQEADPGNASAIAVGGNTQMFIRGDGAVFAKNSIGNGGWVQETSPGNARAIAVSSTGVQMFIRGDNAIFAKNSIGYGGWVQEADPGNASAIAVGG